MLEFSIEAPKRQLKKPLRILVSKGYKIGGVGLVSSGRIVSGKVECDG